IKGLLFFLSREYKVRKIRIPNLSLLSPENQKEEDLYEFGRESASYNWRTGKTAGFYKARNGDLILGYFKNARLTSSSGFFIRFFADEDFVGILRKVHVRGFQHVEAGTLLKLNGPSFCGIFEGTKLIIPVERINQDRKRPFLGFEAARTPAKNMRAERMIRYE
ncbi:MAG: hypothetical protein ACKO96_34350, partial [Flammeovirgaceae bacterium]